MPERLKLQLGKGPDGEVTSLDAALSLPLQGDYLYGAPASATKAKAEVKISRATMPFTQWQEFTLVTCCSPSRPRISRRRVSPSMRRGRGLFR